MKKDLIFDGVIILLFVLLVIIFWMMGGKEAAPIEGIDLLPFV